MVATGQEKVREKMIFSRSGKSQGIFMLFREMGTMKNSRKSYLGQGKFRIYEHNICRGPIPFYPNAIIMF